MAYHLGALKQSLRTVLLLVDGSDLDLLKEAGR
jgi:hypothetical protein